MDQPIRPKTEAEQEADRQAAERDRIDQLRTWDRHSALSAVVGERGKQQEASHEL